MEREILLQCAVIPARLEATVTARWLALLPPRAAARGWPEPAATATGLALLASCARAAGLRLPPARLRREPGGRPYWPDGPGFSITHAAGHAACALAGRGVALGVDLEADGAADLAQLRLVATEREQRAVHAGRLDAVTLWTSKEAVLKAAGADLTEVAKVEIDGDVGRHAGRSWHLQRLAPAPGLCLALASAVPLPVPQVTWPDPAALFADCADRMADPQ